MQIIIIVRGNEQAVITWRIKMNMKRKIQQPTKSIQMSGFVIYLNNSLKNALVRTSCSKLVFSNDCPWSLPSPQCSGGMSCAIKREGKRFSVYRWRDHICLELAIPTSEVPWPSITCEHIPRKPCFPAGFERFVWKRERAALFGSKNSWLRKEIFGKLSFPRGLLVTLFNSS